MQSLGYPAERVNDLTIDFTRVGLPGYGVDLVKSDLLGDRAFQLTDLVVVAVEQLQEAGLGPRRALGRPCFEVGQAMFDSFQVEHEVVDP